ncbi:peptidyl-tRNA hydrolase, mitochondrial isoform X1 [Spinacia oleracea]|uniref:peptidyl-tRNA hydrolase n=1 Tax=Spinacia oleracea TaxID=3562 RepID=A0A9R0ISP9_SPIOL|nr:peptidyl-tRNA hydrolase, mitochondrial-like isoform X1 [Spinacia oleracea]XP_056684246.1 peptidyl-tRNA hydrolase, mitochondrial-like isoform X1 [Spinacia oleracea]XP_056684247.1 peptidyl-tRNA hydrolase, mitochondrial-like isoform X1 [Spinacia oleracea]XP_056684248.1 peptidyl-tRNA hydrolase, mitochondrial-like isoform X1 [Spinacia oleracea]XP_056684249.1 peptidyl-tRNA hydrolase, mitochondrial-like isoform X1 [Spinacia oleracea]
MNIAAISLPFSSSALQRFQFRRTLFSSSSFSSSLISKTLNFSSANSNWKMINFDCLSSSSESNTTAEGNTASSSGDDALQIKPEPKPWLLVGLGNPTFFFNGSRHNVGFEMVDIIAEAEGISMSNSVSFKASFGKGYIGKVPVILSKPLTFMNFSGYSVGPMVSYFKIPLNQVLVIYDDLDLAFARLRLLPKGGHGGHNGMRSVIDHFKGNRDIPRLRIGIGRPAGMMDAASFVLRPFSKQEREELDLTLVTGLEAVRILLLEGFNKSATFVNSAKPLQQLSSGAANGRRELGFHTMPPEKGPQN